MDQVDVRVLIFAVIGFNDINFETILFRRSDGYTITSEIFAQSK